MASTATFVYNINTNVSGDYVSASLSLDSVSGGSTYWTGYTVVATFSCNGVSQSTQLSSNGSGSVSFYVGRGQGYNKSVSISCSLSRTYLPLNAPGSDELVRNAYLSIANSPSYVTLEALPIPTQVVKLDASVHGGYFTLNEISITTTINRGSIYTLPKAFKNNASANEVDNWECIGYTNIVNGKNVIYNVGQGISIDSDLILYPIFRKKLYYKFIQQNSTDYNVGAYIYNNETSITIFAPAIIKIDNYIPKYWNENTSTLIPSTAIAQNSKIQITLITSGKSYYAAYDTNISLTYRSKYELSTVIDKIATYAIYNNIYYIKEQNFIVRKNDDTTTILTSTNTIFKRYGYHSTSWLNTSTNTIVKSNELITINKNTTLQAIWDAAIYKVTYNPNFGVITKGVNELYVQWGNKIDISKNHFAYKLGKGFKGWSIKQDATTNDYEIIMPDNDITIYAVYGTNVYVDVNSKFKEGNSYVCIKNTDGSFSFKECDIFINSAKKWKLSTTYNNII